MAQGLGAGILWGAVTGAVLTVGLSMVAPVVQLAEGASGGDAPSVTVPAPAPEVADTPLPDTVASAMDELRDDPAPEPAAEATPPAHEPEAPGVPEAPPERLAAAPEPEAPVGETAPQVVADPPVSPDGPVSAVAPAVPPESSGAPVAAPSQTALAPPGSESTPSVGEAAPPAPEAVLDVAAPEQGAAISTRPDVPTATAPRLSTAAPTIPAEPGQDAPAAGVEPLPDPPSPAEDRAAAVPPQPDTTTSPEAPEAMTPDTDAPASPQPPTSVLVDRLPRIGSDPAPEADAAEEPASPPSAALPGSPGRIAPSQPSPVPAAPDADLPEDMTALGAHAVPFENPDNRPVLAIVLTDAGGADRPAAEALAGFPFPLTVALDPSAPGASDAMRAYRAAGVELAMFVRFPDDATAQDVAVAWAVHSATLSETVALVDASDGAIQSLREPMAQIVAELARSGHGFVTMPQGFNAGQKLAEREGVPSGLVFRQLDASDRGAMSRTLDQGAFRAGQDGRAILTAPLTEATLAGLAEWGLGTRQASVVLAPLSAALD